MSSRSDPDAAAAGLPLADRLAGALLGQALGDALGFVVEAEPPDVAAGYVRDWLRAGRAGDRAHPFFSFGQYSDDTQLARELLLSLRDAGGWDPAAFARRVAALFAAGRDVGAGAGTRGAALRLLAGASWREAGTPAPYAGNGSAMRVAALGVLYGASPAALRQAAVEQSRVTHQDPRCAAAAVAIAGAAALAGRPGPVVRVHFLEQLSVWVEEVDRETADVVRGLERWADLPPDEAARHVEAVGLEPARQDTWRGISAFVIPSVAWSLYAFLRSPDDWWATVCTAIEVGGDTDTMAAMAGAISGARLGPGALPAGLVGRVNDQGAWNAEELSALARECARYAAG